MTKAEAIAITTLLRPAEKDINEVALRLKMHDEGKISLNADSIKNCVDRLAASSDVVHTTIKMANAELD